MVGARMGAQKQDLCSVADYLETEKSREIRHEYLGGTVYAMSGASRRHNRIGLSIAKCLDLKLSGGPCQVMVESIKLHIRTSLSEFFYYPDVMVGCDSSDDNDYFLESPSLIFEVLSPSTEQIDRREKVLAYQTIASLEHYVIVSQEERRVEWLRREGNAWVASVLTDTEDLLDFPGQGASLTLGEIYEGINFE